jgi:hypothetical protein
MSYFRPTTFEKYVFGFFLEKLKKISEEKLI